MSNPYAVVGLRYDSTDLQLADFTKYFWIATGLDAVPSVRGVDVVVPGKPGRSLKNRENDTLAIVLNGQVTCDPDAMDQAAARSSFRTAMRAVRTLFASNRTPATLEATLEDSTVLTITARPMNIVVPDQVEGVYASLSIELEGYDDWTETGS